MKVALGKWSLAVIMLVLVAICVAAQPENTVPHRIILGLRYDWPTAVICLKNTDALDLFSALRPRMSTYARLLAVPEGNVLIATMPGDRLMLLLDVIEEAEVNGARPIKAAGLLPNVYKQSLTEAEPETTPDVATVIEAQYAPESLGLGRFPVYLVTYAETPGSVGIRANAVFFSGFPNQVRAQEQLARAIDVTNFDQCVAVNGN